MKNAVYRVALALTLIVGIGCSGKAEYPVPDGRSGVKGRCWIQTAEGRKPWAGVRIDATVVSSSKYEMRKVAEVGADANGEFRLPLVAGEQYIIGVYDPDLLKNKATKPQVVRVPDGQFVEVTFEYPAVLADPEPVRPQR